MSPQYWPHLSEHRCESLGKHIVALQADFEAIDKALETSQSRIEKLPRSLGKLISKGISQGIAEASSVECPPNLSSACDRQLLEDKIYKCITLHAAAKARDRVPTNHYQKLAKSYGYIIPKAWDYHVELEGQATMPRELVLAPSAPTQEQQITENHDACAAPMQEEQELPFAEYVTQDNRDEEEEEEKEGEEEDEEEEDEEEEDEEKKDEEKKDVEEEDVEEEDDAWEEGDAEQEVEESVMTKGNEPATTQEHTINIDAYDPDKRLDQCEPLAHTSPVIFKITKQPVVNVLYDMSPTTMRHAVCVAINKKLTRTRTVLGSSYLSNVSLTDGGNICAVTHNERKEDGILLSQMSNWDRDIIDHDVGINFGTHWRYRVHMKGFQKESSRSGHLGTRKPKAALISDLVRINNTTLTSLRVHHIRDVKYRRGTDAEEALAVDFSDIDQATAALLRGMYYKGVRYECETLEKNRFLARCRHCHAVGHPSIKTLCGPPRCGRCSGGHQTWICNSSSPERCALCGGPHASNNPDCPVTKAEKNSIRFSTVSSRGSQSTVHPETAVAAFVSPGPASFRSGALTRTADCVGGIDSDTPKLLTEIDHLRQSVKGLEDSLNAKRWNNKRGKTKKRRALEPLMSGALNGAGKPTKRIKKEEQHEMETMELYRTPSPYIIHRE